MKTTLFSIILSMAVLVSAAQTDPAKAEEYKAKSKEKIAKPYRYDGSKVTYINYGSAAQKKNIEILTLNGISYKFFFVTDGLPKGVTIRVYDGPADDADRNVLFESADAMHKDVSVTSEELLKALQTKKPGATSIKKVYLEYSIPASSGGEKGCIVVSYGYK